MRLFEITMNVQDIVPLPILNNIPQQFPVKASLQAQIYGLIPALEKLGLMDVVEWLKNKIPETEPGIALQTAVINKIPQQPTSESNYKRQAMVAKIIAGKLGLPLASNYF